jgi:uncharacterized membrane-anchored protein
MTNNVKLTALAALCVAQVGAAAWSIARYESVLASGAQYRIRVAPVDPADAFRGRYVAVRPEITVDKPAGAETERVLESIEQGPGTAYVALGTSADGFAQAAQIVEAAPQHGDYLRIEHVQSVWSRPDGGDQTARQTGYTLGFAFDRYYMNEKAAPAAEQQYAQAVQRDGQPSAWLTVRVLDGTGVIEGLFIDGVPIEEVARQGSR